MSKYGMPASVASKRLNFGEIVSIEDHFGKQFQDLGPVRTLMGLVWAYENRQAKTSGGKPVSWAAVESIDGEAVEDMFDPEPTAEDELDPKSQPSQDSTKRMTTESRG